MIITIPRKVSYLRREAVITEKMPLFTISPMKNGVLFKNNAGRSVAQILHYDDVTIVTLGDGGSVALRKTGKEVSIDPIKFDASGIENVDKKRNIKGKLVFFGNADAVQYEIFRKVEVKPTSLVQAVAHPINERLTNIKVADGENILLAVALCMAISMM